MKRYFYLFACVTMMFVACSEKNPVNQSVIQIEEQKTNEEDSTSIPKDTIQPSDDTIPSPQQLVFSSAEEQIHYRTNEFSINMLSMIGRSESEKENICFSPLSASMALGILMNGADGNTLTEMQQTLGFDGLTEEEINNYYYKLLAELPRLDNTTIIKLANSLWVRNDFPLDAGYKEKTRTYFYATIENVDKFTSQMTLDLINGWAAINTNDLIREVLTRDMVSDLTVMIFANALYFKAKWLYEFDTYSTFQENFTTLQGQQISVDMMHDCSYYPYIETDDAQLVELNYEGRQYCMDILLPAENVSLEQYLSTLTYEKWEEYLKQMNQTKYVALSMPKFKFAYNRDLKADLVAAGIRDAFSANNANFSRLSNYGTFLSFIKQYCYMSVNEGGTEAAAVTIGGLDTTGEHTEMKYFKANRSFIFFIREKKYNTLLFTGIVGDPTQE
ncbi:MAG: serpin family protein [Paludibacteraceae bacterium]|nr:serpin family protein [Paludibacteraceae bacterium]